MTESKTWFYTYYDFHILTRINSSSVLGQKYNAFVVRERKPGQLLVK